MLNYPKNAKFIYKKRYGGGLIEDIVTRGVYSVAGGVLFAIISSKGVKYFLDEITLESESEMISRIREEMLIKLLNN
jgi:hypothetical protein